MKSLFAMTLVASAISTASFAAPAPPTIWPAFKDGSTVDCTASFNVGNDGKHYKDLKFEVFYRLDDPRHTDAQAYFKKTLEIDRYKFDGSCGHDGCQLFIRDTKTNILSTTNADFAPRNSNEIHAQVSDYGVSPSTDATIICKKIK